MWCLRKFGKAAAKQAEMERALADTMERACVKRIEERTGGELHVPTKEQLEKLLEIDPYLFKDTKGKLRLTLVPRKIILAIAKVREYGNMKYKISDSWMLNRKENYQDAAFRHWLAYLEDNDSVDEESGLPHLHHLATNIAFLIEGGFKG